MNIVLIEQEKNEKIEIKSRHIKKKYLRAISRYKLYIFR